MKWNHSRKLSWAWRQGLEGRGNTFTYLQEHGNPLQYARLENPMDRGAWRAIVHRVTKSRTQLRWLSTHTHLQEHNILGLFSRTARLFEVYQPLRGDTVLSSSAKANHPPLGSGIHSAGTSLRMINMIEFLLYFKTPAFMIWNCCIYFLTLFPGHYWIIGN